MDDALVERMAEAVVAAGCPVSSAKDIARAALAVAEPAIREAIAANHDDEAAHSSDPNARIWHQQAAASLRAALEPRE